MRSRRLARGIAVGTVVAVIVLISVTAFALWKIWETTTAGYRSISEHALIAQEPLFRVSDMNIVGDNLVINIANTGPSASTVKSVYLYRYEASGTPAQIEVQSQPRDTYVPVGETFDVTIPLSKLYEYMSFERPLRILIETERGTSLIGVEPPVAHITVSVIVPQNVDVRDATVQPLTLRLCGYPVRLAPSPESRPPYLVSEVIITRGFTTTYLVRATVLAVGECTVKLEGKVKIFEVGGKDITRQTYDAPPIKAYIKPSSKDVNVETKLTLRPGGTYEVDFNLPSILVADMQPRDDVKPTLMYDFSWYFIKETSANRLIDPKSVATAIYQTGVIRPASPSGCKLLHPHEWNDEIIQSMRWYRVASNEGEDQAHVGLPVVVEYNRGCVNVWNLPFLVVQVPLEIPQGQHLVIPVFTYDDKDARYGGLRQNLLPALIRFYTQDEYGMRRYHGEIKETSDGGPTQVAYPILINSRGGVMYLNITVYNSSPGRAEDGRAMIILSKVILFRVADYASACSYTGRPLPFATVHLPSGKVDWASRIVFSPLHYAWNTEEAANNVKNLALYSDTYNVTQPRTLEASSGTTRVGLTFVSNVRSEMNYIASGYAVTISVSKRQGENSTLDAVVHQGSGAASPYGSYIYRGLLGGISIPAYWPSVLVASNGSFTFNIVLRLGESGEHHTYILFYAYECGDWWTYFGCTSPRVSYTSFGTAQFTRQGNHYGLYIKSGGPATLSVPIRVEPSRAGSVVYFVFMYVIVVKKPDGYAFATAIGDNLGSSELFRNAEGGLYVLNANPFNNERGAYLTFRLLRLDTGETIGSWSVPVEYLSNNRNSVVLPINGVTVDPLLYLQYWNYALIVQNVKCGVHLDLPPLTVTQTSVVVYTISTAYYYYYTATYWRTSLVFATTTVTRTISYITFTTTTVTLTRWHGRTVTSTTTVTTTVTKTETSEVTVRSPPPTRTSRWQPLPTSEPTEQPPQPTTTTWWWSTQPTTTTWRSTQPTTTIWRPTQPTTTTWRWPQPTTTTWRPPQPTTTTTTWWQPPQPTITTTSWWSPQPTTTTTTWWWRPRPPLPPLGEPVLMTVVEGSGVRLSQYAVRVELNETNFSGWDAVSGVGGIFFVDGRTGLPLYYWVESFDRERRHAMVWVRVDSVPAKGTVPVLMFYGGENQLSGRFHDPGKVFYYFNDFEGGSLKGMTVFGASSWRVVSGGAQGLYAASGGPYTSGLRLAVDAPTQALVSFQVKVSPGSARDALIFRVDGAERVKFSGGLDWGQYSFVAPAGTRTFEWVYVGGGRAWVDSVVVRPYVSPEPTVIFGGVAAG